jgi:hypothetical protein
MKFERSFHNKNKLGEYINISPANKWGSKYYVSPLWVFIMKTLKATDVRNEDKKHIE